MQIELTNTHKNIILLAAKYDVPLTRLGRISGHSGTYFYYVRSTFSNITLQKVADAFDISISDLYASPEVDITEFPGNVGVLTRLRYICAYLHISHRDFFSQTGIYLNKAYIRHFPQETLSKIAEMFDVSLDYLMTGASAVVEEEKLRYNRAQLTWKLSGYNTGEERDLIVSIARDRRINVCELRQLFMVNNLPPYLLKTRGQKSYRPNMTLEERRKIALLLQVPEEKLSDISGSKNGLRSSCRLAAHNINKDYPYNLIDILETRSIYKNISAKELEFALSKLTLRHKHYIEARFEVHKTVTAIGREMGVSKQNASEITKKAITCLIENIGAFRLGESVGTLYPLKTYPENILYVLRQYTDTADMVITAEMLETATTKLSENNKKFYQYFFREGRSVAEVQHMLGLSEGSRGILHNKRHSVVKQLIYHIKKVVQG